MTREPPLWSDLEQLRHDVTHRGWPHREVVISGPRTSFIGRVRIDVPSGRRGLDELLVELVDFGQQRLLDFALVVSSLPA